MIPAARVDRALLAFAAFAAIAYLILGGALPIPLAAALKSSMCATLALLAATRRSWMLCGALMFSALGDALLRIDGARLFVPALASFFVTHIAYAAIFYAAAKKHLVQNRTRGSLKAVVLLFAVTYLAILWPHLGALTVPVTAYVAAIVAMTMLSLRVAATWIPAGAILFLVSDSVIALGRFLWQAEWLGPAIWITYALAQLAITAGVLSTTRRDG